MPSSKRRVNEYRALKKSRWFGSFRVRPDGRLSFSPWSYSDLSYVAINVAGQQANVLVGGRSVMLLYLERNRIVSACLVATLDPEGVRTAVAALRNANPGLDSWVVPALEYNFAWSSVREDPEMFKVIRELLESCRDLPVAKHWQRVRAQYFANQGVSPPDVPTQKRAATKMQPGTATRKRRATPRT